MRQESAGKARGGLIEVAAILGPELRTPEFERLIEVLATGSEEALTEAEALWPAVERAISEALPRILP